MIAERKIIIILAPHTDDGEMGCGGTISKYAKKHDIIYVAFSWCGNEKLKTEVSEATKLLSVKELRIFDYPVRRFTDYRQNILQRMIDLRDELKPDIIYTPSLQDIHQDHAVITNEAIRAFKFSSILCYELPWNNFSFNTCCFEKLEERQIEDKCGALAFYKSQKSRHYMNSEFVYSLARIRGTQINTRYAEAFEIIRWIR